MDLVFLWYDEYVSGFCQEHFKRAFPQRPQSVGAFVVQSFTPRQRKVRILATLGPASANPAMIAELHRAGADAFRVNMSHGDHAGHAKVIAAIRALEKDTGRPTTILVDLQGDRKNTRLNSSH